MCINKIKHSAWYVPLLIEFVELNPIFSTVNEAPVDNEDDISVACDTVVGANSTVFDVDGSDALCDCSSYVKVK